MARLKVIEPEQAEGKAKELFEGPFKDMHINIFKGMANSPAVLEAYLGMEKALSQGLLTAKEREVIMLTVGEANKCDYCVSAHTMLGKQAGLSEEETIAARKGELTNPKLAAVATFASALHEKKGWVSDDDLAAFRNAGYTDGHIAEVVANYVLSTFTNYFNHVNETDVDVPAAPALTT